MIERYHYITVKMQPDDESPVTDFKDNHSIFMNSGFKLNSSRVVGPLQDNIKKDESLGHIWHDVPPNNGKYTFELGTELPYYLPNLDQQPEYFLSVDDIDCFVCNRMVRAYFGTGHPDGGDGEDYILVHRRGIPSLVEQKHKGLHPLPMRTFFSCSFSVISPSAENAIQENFIVWRNKLLELICIVVSHFRIFDQEKSKHLFPFPAITSYPVFWLAVIGADSKIGCEQFTGDVRTVSNRSLSDVVGEASVGLKNSLKNSQLPPIHESTLATAYSMLHYGHYNQAIIYACTAAETLFSKSLQSHLSRLGVSKSQIERALDDVTFSQLLNLHLFYICNINDLHNYQELLGKANWTRKRRNEIVHTGDTLHPLGKKDVTDGINSVAKIMSFIEKRVSKESTTKG